MEEISVPGGTVRVFRKGKSIIDGDGGGSAVWRKHNSCQVAHASPGRAPPKKSLTKSIAVRNATCVKVPKKGTFNPYSVVGAP